MRIATLLLTAALLTACESVPSGTGSPGALTDSWPTDVDAAISQSRREGRPVFVLFSDAHCPMCVKFARRVLSNDATVRHIQNMCIAVKVDLTDPDSPNQRIADRYGVRRLPTAKVFAADGREIGSFTGLPQHPTETPAKAFALWLDERLASNRGR
ncbi:MAG: thioredoxin family protein [Phycisphaeraceae bacterium]|nr:thioredoxin family protein [Phycisphaeraceae bacterium]